MFDFAKDAENGKERRLLLKEKLEKERWNDADVWELTLAYAYINAYWARRYARGDESRREELAQAGYLFMFRAIPKCEEREQLEAFLFQRMRGEIRDEAQRQWGSHGWRRVELDDEEPVVEAVCALRCEPEFEFDAAEAEVAAFLRSHLDGRDLAIALLLYRGFSQPQAARILRRTRQTVNARLMQIRRQLRPFLHEILTADV